MEYYGEISFGIKKDRNEPLMNMPVAFDTTMEVICQVIISGVGCQVQGALKNEIQTLSMILLVPGNQKSRKNQFLSL